jgi:hypothetical protein
MNDELRTLVRARAAYRCEYCLIPEELVSTPFQIDHIIAESHGGPTEPSNLAFACFYCNNFKGPNIAGIDPVSQEIVRLFHPRTDRRVMHFSWDGLILVGLTPIGRATIRTLRLNHPERVAIRRSLFLEGVSFSVD